MLDLIIRYFMVGLGVSAGIAAIFENSIPAALVTIAASIFYHR